MMENITDQVSIRLRKIIKQLIKIEIRQDVTFVIYAKENHENKTAKKINYIYPVIKMIDIPYFVSHIENQFNLEPGIIFSKIRLDNIIYYRYACIHIIRKNYKSHISSVELGKIFGGRDHSSILYAINEAEIVLRRRYKSESDIRFAMIYEKIESIFNEFVK